MHADILARPLLRDCYRLLQVDRAATPGEIHDAYRRLARKWHPDVDPSPGATYRMQLLNEAHDILGDPLRRAEHDAALGLDDRHVPAAVDLRFCPECMGLLQLLGLRKAPPCEWCERPAMVCAPREGSAEGEVLHYWLCEPCLYTAYF